MKATSVAIVIIALLTAGCSSVKTVVTAEIKLQCGTNVVTVSQPKDTVIDRLEFDPKNGRLVLFGYQSTVNAAAIEAAKAQADAQAEVWKAGFSTLQALGERASGAMIPKGYKLAPADDASKPAMEVEE